MMPSTHYQHSGKVPLGGMLLTLVGGGALGITLGAVYGLVIYYSPFVYINAIVTFALGAFLAFGVGTLAKFGKIRNAAVVAVLGLLIASAAYYVHWVVWVERMSGADSADPQMHSVTSAGCSSGGLRSCNRRVTGDSLEGVDSSEERLQLGPLRTVRCRASPQKPGISIRASVCFTSARCASAVGRTASAHGGHPKPVRHGTCSPVVVGKTPFSLN